MKRLLPIAARLALIAVACRALTSCGSSGDSTTTPAATTYTIGGTVSGLTGTGLVLQDNGGSNLSVTANGSFTFATEVANAGAYAVTVLTQASGQTCTVTAGSGTVGTANITSVVVTCVPTTYTVSVTVSGLTGTGLVLQDNGASNLSVPASSTVTFATALTAGTAYAVTVFAQPTGQTCTVTNGSGTIAANVTNVTVACVAATYTIAATVSGLTGTGLVLQDNLASNLTVTTSGTVTFATALSSGAAYSVTVLTQPLGQTCTVTNGSGTVASANVTTVAVACTGLTEFLYGANQSDGIAGFSINASTGIPTALGGSPFASEVAAPGDTLFGWIAGNPVGNFVYLSLFGLFGSNNIQAWSASSTTGALTAIGGAPFPGLSPIGPMVFAPGGSFAYIANFGGTPPMAANSISIYSVGGSGALTAASGSPFKIDSLGAEPTSLVITPNGKFLYSANFGISGAAGNITGYSVNSTTGALTAISGSPFTSTDSIFASLSSLAVSPNGQFLFLSGVNGVAAYTINSSTGALTQIVGSPFASAPFPGGIVIDPGGRFLYTSSVSSNGVGTGGISAYTINATTGALTQMSGSPFQPGTFGASIVMDIAGQFLYTGNIGNTGTTQTTGIGGFSINQTTGGLTQLSGSPFMANATKANGVVFLTIIR